MTFTETAIEGVLIVDADTFPDKRGAFVRIYMPNELRARGLDTEIAHCGMTVNHTKGTIRGLHYQDPPFSEVKFVRATAGSVFDVAVDLRPDSPTYCQWVGVELSATNRRALYIPKGCAHAYQTLTDHAEVLYMVSAPYSLEHARGARWDDPAFGIEWPLGKPAMIIERDANYPDYVRQ